MNIVISTFLLAIGSSAALEYNEASNNNGSRLRGSSWPIAFEGLKMESSKKKAPKDKKTADDIIAKSEVAVYVSVLTFDSSIFYQI